MNTVQHSDLLSRVDLNLFRVFDTVFEERNLTRAAKRLSVSQSAVSHALNRLREQLGDPLFEREGRGVAPTPLAIRMAPDVRAAFQALARGAARARPFDPATDVGRCVVAMPDIVEPMLLPALYAGLPGIHVVSARLRRDTLEADLAARRVDLSVDVLRATPLRRRALVADRLCVLRAKPGKVGKRAYRAAGHVAVSSRPSGDTATDMLLRGLGEERDVRLRCQTYEAAARVVANSDLMLTLPERQARATASLAALQRSRLPFPAPPSALQLYWHPRHEHDERLCWLRDQVFALAESIPPLRS